MRVSLSVRLVLCIGASCNVGISVKARIECLSFVIDDSSFSTAEYLSGEVAGIDIDVGVTIHLCEVTAAINVSIDRRGLRSGTLEEYAGRTDDLTHKLWVAGVIVYLDILVGNDVAIFIFIDTFLSTVSASEDRATDICLVANS